MKKVLVTGAGGFIGSHLTERCLELGFQVKALVHYNSQNSWGWLEQSRYKDEVEVISGDIRDFDLVHTSLKDVDTVFHLAALIGIPYSYVSPLAYIKTNLIGTYNVLQGCRELETEKVIVTSTSETYGTAQYVPIDEKHPAVGQSPYSASKIAADQLATSFHLSFDLPVTIVRPFNTYGPRQSARAIIPTIISQILDGVKTITLGNLHPTRDLTFVQDTVKGFLAVAESRSLVGEAVNIGMNKEVSMAALVDLIAELMNVEVKVAGSSQRIRPEKSEVGRLCCNNAKILSQTQWQPQTDLRSGLQKTIAWLENNIDLYKPSVYNI